VTASRTSRHAGLTLVEVLFGVLLSSMLFLAALAIWDSAGRLDKNEIDVADAQGNLRFGLGQISRAVRAAGAGGLFVAQAVLLRPDPDLPGVSVPPDDDYDNVVGGSVTDLSGAKVPVRPGTDVLEVRGTIFSPLLGFDGTSGCGACNGANELTVHAVTTSGLVNDDPALRPRFAAIDLATAGASDRRPIFVLASGGDDVHPDCSQGASGVPIRAPQPTYRVGLLQSPTALAAGGTMGVVDFTDPGARELATEDPRGRAAAAPDPPLGALRRAGILDDVVFFVDDSDPDHPTLARALRRGTRFDVVPLAEDVEDLQVAYGVDGLYRSDAVRPDGGIGRLVPPTAADADASASNRIDGDEWVPNVPGERPLTAEDLRTPTGCPLLSQVRVALVAKARDPDPTFRGRGASGFRVFDAAGEARDYSRTNPRSPRYRRRVLAVTIALRNFEASLLAAP
jgi:hypothetical protein